MKISIKTTVQTVAFFTIIFFVSQKILADTHYVSLTGGNIPPYSTWADAAHNIQDAVNVSIDDDVVIVTNGIYNSGQTVTPGFSQLNRVVITNNILVQSVNGPETTIIDGAGTVRCVFMTKGMLNGFTITNGHSYVSGIVWYNASGGGVWLTNNCMVTNCMIRGNRSWSFGGGVICYFGGKVIDCTVNGNNSYGSYPSAGGVMCWGGGEVINSTIRGNSTAGTGGGGYCPGGYLTNCNIIGNSANDYAGGVYQGTLNNCIVSSNSAADGGGTYFSALSNCVISGNCATNNGGGVYRSSMNSCSVTDNSATNNGGGVYLYQGGEAGALSNCLISGNNAHNGGGIFLWDAHDVMNCTISSNFANSRGGGVFCNLKGQLNSCTISGNSAGTSGGGVECYGGGELSKCIIMNNSASYGGGVECLVSGSLTNCLIVGFNIADYGGGIYCNQGGQVYNCTISSNHANFFGGGVSCNNGGSLLNSIIYHNSASQGGNNWHTNGYVSGFSYCCITPTNNLPQYNCIPDDPMFQLIGSDYHLLEGSPCIDAGDDMYWMSGTTDLDGNPRIFGDRVDMGCYEFIPEPGFYLLFIIYYLLIGNLIRRIKFSIKY